MVNFFPIHVCQEISNSIQNNFSDAMTNKTTMINFFKWYRSGKHSCNINRIMDHIDHIKKLIGSEHIGIGSDIEGTPAGFDVKGMEDISKFPIITQSLYERGYTDDEVVGILGGNLIRVLKIVESKKEN